MTGLELREGATLERLAGSLRTVVMEAGNGFNGKGDELANRYRRWLLDAEQALGNSMTGSAVSKLLHSPYYWTLKGAFGGEPGIVYEIQAEVARIKNDLQQLLERVDALKAKWGACQFAIVPDTNVFLHAKQPFHDVDWLALAPSNVDVIYLVIPLVVVDELDAKKSHPDDRTKRRARKAVKKVEELLAPIKDVAELSRSKKGRVVMLGVLEDEPDGRRLPIADSEIAERARYLRTLTNGVVIVATLDTGMKIRSATVGLETVSPPEPDDDTYQT